MVVVSILDLATALVLTLVQHGSAEHAQHMVDIPPVRLLLHFD